MKLIRASFENFRLLRGLELQFSTDQARVLTVVRAANETGKTTILNGLQWALYGDAALPGKGQDYRLHPIDWDPGTGRVPITATVEFEVVTHRQTATGLRETRKGYRLVRSAFEDVNSDSSWRRSPSSVKLFELTDKGAEVIEASEAFIADELPMELREVFFTDGDRALSFIEADVTVATKRDRVEKAIRSLLGLGVIEDAIRHIHRAEADINRQAKGLGGGGELANTASQLEKVDNDITRFEGELADAAQQFRTFDEEVATLDRRIAAILQKGDREKLQRDHELATREIERLDERLEVALKDHGALFRSQSLARAVLAPALDRAFAQLEQLRDRRKIPNATIPVLEDRLAARTCICGESLEESTSEGARRRSEITNLIEISRRADETQGIVTELYFGAKSLQQEPLQANAAFFEEYKRIVQNRDDLQDLRDEAGRKLKAIDLQIDDLADADIQGLRETRRRYLDQRDRFLQKQAQCETQLSNLRGQQQKLVDRRDQLLREQKKGARILAELDVSKDIRQVLERSYQRIVNEELRKVSDLMNSLFLEMIGADPEQGAIIQRAEISPTFDIVVYGPGQRTLNPDRDLNGASRRALTLAFILALTKVSDVEAPSVIDTPLGTMSGYVKRAVLRKTIQQSAQLVLFLTHAEIEGCEEILDQAAGVVTTLTNPAHFPRMLTHDPGTRELKILSCRCNHRRVCALCERRADVDALPQAAP